MTDLSGLAGATFTPIYASAINDAMQVVGYGYGSATGGLGRGYLLSLQPDWVGGDGYWDDYNGTHWSWGGIAASANPSASHDVVLDPGVSAKRRSTVDIRPRPAHSRSAAPPERSSRWI